MLFCFGGQTVLVSFALRPIGVFRIFLGNSSHHARIGSSRHLPDTLFSRTILLGPYAFSLCRFFADFSVTCTLRREWEFLHRPRLRSRPGNAPTPCRHHEPPRKSCRHWTARTAHNTPRKSHTTPKICTMQPERRNDQKTINAPIGP